MMVEVHVNPKILEVCTDEKRIELEEIHKAIEECEKKLNLYLEEKKKAFSRFYFVSNQTLIDILSNGNNPYKISSEYLGDLFDGVRKVDMVENKDSKLGLPHGISMVAKDGERVKFKTPFEPKDEVEIWLSRLSLKIRRELSNVLIDSK